MRAKQAGSKQTARISYSMRSVLLACMIVAAGFGALVGCSEATLMWARTLTFSALIVSAVAWPISSGQTRAFSAAFTIAGWSYLLLVHSDVMAETIRYGAPNPGLAHLYVAEILWYSLWNDPTARPSQELFATTFSYVFTLLLCCLAGACASHFGVPSKHLQGQSDSECRG